MRLSKALGALLASAGSLGAFLAAPAAASAGSNGLGSFHPLSVTFVSLEHGWALGTVPCKSTGACLTLAETADAGRTWAARPLPAKLVAAADRPVTNGVPAGKAGYVRLPAVLYGLSSLGVRFADGADGWIWGGLAVSDSSVRAELWSTHDGGATWRQIPVLAGSLAQYYGSVLDLEAADGYAYLMAPDNHDGVDIESTPVGSDAWHIDRAPLMLQPAGGTQLEGAIVLQAGRGWALVGNDRGVTGSASLAGKAVWSNWAAPCAKVGDSFVVPAAPTASDLVTACQMGGYAYSLSKYAPPGAKLGSWWLYFSHDGGQTWSAGPELGPNGYAFSGLVASPLPATALVGYGEVEAAPPAQLLASFNGGRTWARVYRGEFLYLGFTSPNQGVGIVRLRPSNVAVTEMVMTFDGGRSWSKVHF